MIKTLSTHEGIQAGFFRPRPEQKKDDQGCLARSAIAMTFGARMSLPQLRGSDTAAADDVAMPRSFAWRAISCYLMCNRGAYEMRLESCARDFTSSFRKALPRWYSTVFGLMNS